MTYNSWGYYMQGSDQQIEAEELGAWLSTIIHCGVHNNAWGKPVYECKCGILFPLWGVKAAFSMGQKGIDIVVKMHKEGFHIEESMTELSLTRPTEVRYTEHGTE